MPARQISGVKSIVFETGGKLSVDCTYTDGFDSSDGSSWEYQFNLSDILGLGADLQVVPGGTGFFSASQLSSSDVRVYPNQHGASNLNLCYKCISYKRFGSKSTRYDASYTFDLMQIFDFTSRMTLKPRDRLLALHRTGQLETTPLQKKLFDGLSLSPDGVFSLCMRDIQGKTNRTLALNFELDKVIGLSSRQLIIGQTGFFSKGLTKGIHLDSDDAWKMYYKIYPADGESDWSDYKTYDLAQLFYLDDRLRLKGHPELGDAKNASTAKQEYASSAHDHQAPPKYQPNVNTNTFDLSSMKTALDFAMREVDGLKNDASLNERRHRIEVDELKSKLRTARSTARDKISSLKRTIRRLREELEDDDDDDDESGEDDDDDDDDEE